MNKKRKSKRLDELCLLCQKRDFDEFSLGEMKQCDNIRCHYHCLLFACGLTQQGGDEDGIVGFLTNDIQKEARRGTRLKCRYCRKKGATSACAIPSCRVTFHVPCGIKNNTLHQFFGSFKSFCPSHRPRQIVPLKYRSSGNRECAICRDSIAPISPFYKELWAPCCSKWLHRDCVQRQAYNAGKFFFRCPLCNSKDAFVEEMEKFGIYAPEKDASWELEENAYQELQERYERCDAETCLCPRGRNYDEDDNNSWTIVVCELCASQGVHIKCGNVSEDELQTWACNTCSEVEKRKQQSEHMNPKRLRRLSPSPDSDAENSNVNINTHRHEMNNFTFAANSSDSSGDTQLKAIDLTFKNIGDECKSLRVKYEDKIPLITID